MTHPVALGYTLDTGVYEGPQRHSQAMVGRTMLMSTNENLPTRDFLAALLSSPGDAISSSCTQRAYALTALVTYTSSAMLTRPQPQPISPNPTVQA